MVDTDLAPDEVRELAGSVGLTIRDEEIARLRETIGALLQGADGVYSLPLPGEPTGTSERSWRVPRTDEYNSLACVCTVPSSNGDGPLSGFEIGVKDIIAVAGVPMECGSDCMRGFVPSRDATVVRWLLEAGASITAKTNLDAFAGSARGTTSTHGQVCNPHGPAHTAGGSSGGSAAAVAVDRVRVALGTDTGGSIRIPASFCGVVGLKPTYGLVPLTGVVENTYSQDHVGPIASDVADVASVLEVIVGRDPHDPASLAATGHPDARVGEYTEAVESPVSPEAATVGVLENGIGDDVRDAVADRTRAVADHLADAGATVRSISVDYYEQFRPVKNVLSATEVAAHWRADGAPIRRGGFVDPAYQTGFGSRRRARDRDVPTFYKGKILAGAHLLENDAGAVYTYAQAAREVLRAEFETALDGVDALVLPTTPDVAPPLAEAADPGFDYARNTRPANVTKLPALTIPHGTVDGLPVGVQLVGEAFGERDLLGLGALLEPALESPSA